MRLDPRPAGESLIMDNIYLMGSEAVQSAGVSIRSAADSMTQAAGEISSAMFQERQHRQEFLDRFENAVERMTLAANLIHNSMAAEKRRRRGD